MPPFTLGSDDERSVSTVRAPTPRARPLLPAPLHRFLFPASQTGGAHHPPGTHPWHRVLWLTGVDYFSTLGYQPGIAFLAAGAVAPLATLVLVAVTLVGALPIYAQVAGRSFAGQGSIAMLEKLMPGWFGKVFVLALLGFASTDFVITMTLSAADAAKHAVENPLLHRLIGEHHVLATCVLLALLAAVFLRGFTEAIGAAAIICVPYLVLNAVVLARGLFEVATHPEAWAQWRGALEVRGDTAGLALAAVLLFPRLALGMSGFETGASVMPLVKGDDSDGTPPRGRIRNTRRLLAAAALIMSVYLLCSSLVTTLLIPAGEFARGGKAEGRALAWVAHQYLGGAFGSAYDLSTIVILWYAGASAMAAMLNLIPRYLPRFGMAPKWASHARPLVLVLLGIDLVVTLIFQADVEAQGGAYATGVLALMLSAAVAVALAFHEEAGGEGSRAERRRKRVLELFFWCVTALFAFTLVDNVIARPDGLIISAVFILAILALSSLSRWSRAAELRIEHLTFADEQSQALFAEMRRKRVNIVPLRTATAEMRASKARQVRRHYKAAGLICFLHVNAADDRSEFTGDLRVTVRREDEDYVVTADKAVAIPNAIAYISEQLDPIALYMDLSLSNPTTQALKFLLWGEGEIGVMVYQILVRYWQSTPEDDVRPYIYLVSR